MSGLKVQAGALKAFVRTFRFLLAASPKLLKEEVEHNKSLELSAELHSLYGQGSSVNGVSSGSSAPQLSSMLDGFRAD